MDAAGNQNGVYTNTSGITYSKAGISNDGDTGIQLDGDTNKGYVSIADKAAQHVGDTFTMGFWVRVDYILEANTGLFTSGSGTGGPSIGLNGDGTVSLGKDGISFIQSSSTQNLNDGLKHFVVWTKNGSTNKCYFDRGVDVTGSIVNATVSNATGYVIGRNHGASSTQFLRGFVDEVMLFPTALSQAQVQALYDLAFVFTTAPTATASGIVLSATAGITNQSATGKTYQWRNNLATILGATATSYSSQSSDYGQEIDAVVTAASVAGFTTDQATNQVSPDANGHALTLAQKPIVADPTPTSGVGKYWEPCVVLDSTNSQYVLFADPASGPGFNATGLGRWTCPYTSNPTLAASWTYTGDCNAGTITSSSTVVDQGTHWRLYYYKSNIITTSALYTRTSTDQGATWSAEGTAIAANAVVWSAAWNGSSAWPTNGVASSANWEMLVGGYIPSTMPAEFALAYAKSTDSGATYTLQNGGFYTTPASPVAGCRGGGPCVLFGGAKYNGYYYAFDHISSQVDHQSYPTDIVLMRSSDLTSLTGWTSLGYILNHNAISAYTGTQVADGWGVEHGGSLYVFYSGVRAPSTDQGGSVLGAFFPGTTAQFITAAVVGFSSFPVSAVGGLYPSLVLYPSTSLHPSASLFSPFRPGSASLAHPGAGTLVTATRSPGSLSMSSFPVGSLSESGFPEGSF